MATKLTQEQYDELMQNSMIEPEYEAPVEQPEMEEEGPISKLESGLRGAGQGLTFNYLDEIIAGAKQPTGALEKIMRRISDETSEPSEDLKAYEQEVEFQRQEFRKAEEENPLTYLAGEVTGGIAPAIATGGASMMAKGGLSAIKAGAALGAGQGALASTGLAESDEDLKKAAITGAGGGAIMGGLAGSIPAAGKFLRDQSGIVDSFVESASRKLKGEELLGKTVGKKIYKESIAKGSQLSSIIDDAQDMIQKGYQNIFGSAKEMGVKMPTQKLATDIESDLTKKMMNSISPTYKENVEKLRTMMSNLKSIDDVSPEQLNDFAGEFYDLGRQFKLSGDTKAFGEAKNIYGKIKETLKGNLPDELRTQFEKMNASYQKLRGTVKELSPQLDMPETFTNEKVGQKIAENLVRGEGETLGALKSAEKAERIFDTLQDIAPHNKELGAVRSSMEDLAKRQDINIKATKFDPFNLSSYEGVGARAGAVAGGLGRIAKLPKDKFFQLARIAVNKNAGNKAPEKLLNMVQSLTEATPEKRSALLFSMSQQPAYRDFVNSLVMDDTLEE